jgi:hypothetical protein
MRLQEYCVERLARALRKDVQKLHITFAGAVAGLILSLT